MTRRSVQVTLLTLAFIALVAPIAVWTDASYVRMERMTEAMRSRGVSRRVTFWTVRLFVDTAAILSVVSVGVLLASRSRRRRDRGRPPTPGETALKLLVLTVLLTFAQTGLEWQLGWRGVPRPPILYLVWLRGGNHAAMAVLAGWSLLAITGLDPRAQADWTDRAGRYIAGIWLGGALSWWSVWSFCG